MANAHKCNPFDFYTIHYEGYIGDSNHKVFDSRLFDEGKPFRFHQGFYEVIKCWDMAVYLLSTGDSIEIVCPAKFAFGGVSTYSHFDHEQIPPNTDIKYKIEVFECEGTIQDFNKANKKYKLPDLIEKKSQERIIGTGKIIQDSKHWDASTVDGHPKKTKELSQQECAIKESKKKS